MVFLWERHFTQTLNVKSKKVFEELSNDICQVIECTNENIWMNAHSKIYLCMASFKELNVLLSTSLWGAAR